ncbi:MAG: SDR family NAD(P)-dependent oxidoreductase [Clostridiales bacterium]|nr:SDR family NAD(P)-dependent oxidoreductase [Clostridiales bacterium]
MSVKDLVKMSNKYGANPEFVLAGGGNTSFKTAKELYIKGSGTTLATITQDGFVKIDRKKLSKMWSTEYPQDEALREARVLEDLMASRFPESSTKRPSVETALHDLFVQKYVLHVHPAAVNGITCSPDSEKTVKAIFGKKAAWIKATKPGYILARDTKRVIEDYRAVNSREPDVLFIENHGIFFAADTCAELDVLVASVMDKIAKKLKKKPDFSAVDFDAQTAAQTAPLIREALSSDGENAVVNFTCNKETARLASSYEQFKSVELPFTPDHMVYCRHTPLYVKAQATSQALFKAVSDGIEKYRKSFSCKPKIIFVEGLGMFCAGKTKKEADIARDVFLDEIKISVYALNFGGGQFMSAEDIDFIRNWEVESYRQKIALSADAGKRLDGKISIVTGAAQGFGKGIAEDMIKQGAYVAIADLNYDGAKATADGFCEVYGKGAAFAVCVNAGDEESVKAMLQSTVLEYGGLDIFVNNAGIVKAGTLDEMQTGAFELVTKVNYTAYFLGAKYASKIMKIQHECAPGKMFDIIQINSKSGLEGSNKNFAYAGSKFGGIGLTQSFALELAPYNIKVNSVCPGNFLDGPLWCDPERGLFVQYLKAGKVKGAKTVEDVKRFYESKVPLNRGCLPEDVSRAIFYIVEQKYETGQALPVTGGQVMLN